MKLTNKNILVTGANGGIGKEFAKMCASYCSDLYLVIRKENPELADELIASGARSVKTLIADLSIPEQVASLCENIQDLSVDVVFNNVGMLTGGLIEE